MQICIVNSRTVKEHDQKNQPSDKFMKNMFDDDPSDKISQNTTFLFPETWHSYFPFTAIKNWFIERWFNLRKLYE